MGAEVSKPEPATSDADFMAKAISAIRSADDYEGGGESEAEASEPAAPAGRDDKGRFTKGKVDGQAQAAQSEESESEEVASAPRGNAKPKAAPKVPGGAEEDVRGTVRAAADAAPGSEIAQLRELAKKHGYTVDESGRVEVRERAQFREERRQLRQEVAAEREAGMREIEQMKAQLREVGQGVFAAQQAARARDFDGMARALGFKDWNDVNNEALGVFADPNYKRMAELERQLQERNAAEQRAREEQVRVQAAQREAAHAAAYRQNLSAEMATSDDPMIQAFADDPAFVGAVFRLQQQHFDGVETISYTEAVDFRPKGGRSLREEMRAVYNRLVKAGLKPEETSDQAAAKPEPAKAGGRQGAPSSVRKNGSTTLSRKDASDAAAKVRVSSMDDRDFVSYGTQLLKNADDYER